MLSLEDARWPTLLSGRRTPYDASVPLRAMELGVNVWDELWEELHHQGDIGEAAYAAIPHIVRISSSTARDWNLYALAAIIEIERHRNTNPPLPSWAAPAYQAAWVSLRNLALKDLVGPVDSPTTLSALSVLALAQGNLKLGAMLSYLDEAEISAFVENHLAWSGLYA